MEIDFVTRCSSNSDVIVGEATLRIRRSAGACNSPKPTQEFRKRLETELSAGLYILDIPASDASSLIDGLDREYEHSFHIDNEIIDSTRE